MVDRLQQNLGKYPFVTLADVKDYLSISSTTQDARITNAITYATGMVEHYIGQEILANDYDEIFEELAEKYGGQSEVAPEIKLLMMLGGSAFMFHLTNTMFKTSLPGMDDILKQNPELMQQFAKAAVNTPKSEPEPQGMGGGMGGMPGMGNFKDMMGSMGNTAAFQQKMKQQMNMMQMRERMNKKKAAKKAADYATGAPGRRRSRKSLTKVANCRASMATRIWRMRSTNAGGASPSSSDSAAVASNCECNAEISLTNCSIGRATWLLVRELVIVIRKLLHNCHHQVAGFDH